MSLILRIAERSEIPAVAELKRKMFEEAGLAHLLHDNFIESVTKVYDELYLNGKARHYIIEQDNQIAACAGGFMKDDLPYCFYKEPLYGFIGDVYVDPAFRRRGYAKTLTLEVIAWFQENGIGTARLLASPHARGLYESIGFQGTSEMALQL